MPNSGTVSAGSVALASQYNNLRADVLSNTTGHVHDGTTDGGKQIEGTVIKSTGATSGYVLTAGAGGTSTTWAAPTTGAINSVTGTAAFAAITPVLTFYNHAAPAEWVTGSGTVIYSIGTASRTTSSTVYYYNLAATAGTIARSGTLTANVITAGTVTYTRPAAKGFSGDGFVFLEGISATTSGTISSTLRRYTANLGTNSWNTTIYAAATYASVNWNVFDAIAFVTVKPQWISEANSWFSFDLRSALNGTSFLFAVNDTTGTLYTAAYGTTTNTSTDRLEPYGVSSAFAAYVPGAAGADGTVHMYYWRRTASAPNTYEWIRKWYTLGTAGFTAGGTVTSTTGWQPFAQHISAQEQNFFEYPYTGWWDAASTAYIMRTFDGVDSYHVGLDRTMGTVLFRSKLNDLNATGTTFANTRFDPVTRLMPMTGNGNVGTWRAGDPGQLYSPRRPVTWTYSPAVTSSFPNFEMVMGNGSVTHVLDIRAGGSGMYTIPIANQYTSFTIPSASVARIVMEDSNYKPQQPIASVAAGSSFYMNAIFGEINDTTNTYSRDRFVSSAPFILPANQSFTCFVSNVAYPIQGATSSNTWYVDGTATVASTAVFGFRTISLT